MPEPDPPQSHPDDVHLHSVFDEPAIFPQNENQLIECDWLCSECGYNLRGLNIGAHCPECNKIELYAPPPPDAPSYGWWLREKQRRVSSARSWLTVIAVTLLTSPLAILGAFFNAAALGVVLVVFMGPTIEELLKIAATVLVVELRPYVIKNRAQIWLMALGSATLFAVLENLWYLEVFIRSPTKEVIIWRWVVCTAMHLVCTGVAAMGALAAWTASVEQFRKPVLTRHIAPIVIAVVIHGVYNLTALVLDHNTVLF